MKNRIVSNYQNIFNSDEYIHYVVQYEGTYLGGDLKNSDIYITIINSDYAALSIRGNLIDNPGNTKRVIDLAAVKISNEGDFKIIYVLPPEMYTLEEISAIEATKVSLLQLELPLNLTGKGVIVGIIDTGIDYLNEEFMDENGKTRIAGIWDQTVVSEENNEIVGIPFGTFYNRDDINKAIDVYRQGGNPYDIVKTTDKIGHGTNMAGIVGARGKSIRGIAYECEFVIIKLTESNYFKKRFQIDIPVYGVISIFSSIEFIKDYLITKQKPGVALLPLGTNNGNHRGDHIIDEYIASITSNIGIVIVTGTGNEALEDNHVSGIIRDINDEDTVQIIVSQEQKNLFFEFWADLPNIFDISIVSPSGEETGFIPAILNMSKAYTFVFEKTQVYIYYYLPEEYSGEEMISVYLLNVQPGIWKIKSKLRLGKMANYNIWLSQKGITVGGTRVSPSDPYGTLNVPSDSQYVITVGAYDQNNNNILSYSGMSFKDKYENSIDFVAGGVNTLTTGLNNTLQVINGTSLSAAIGAGTCVLLLEWGIVNGNYPYMYSQSIKTFLQRGTIVRSGETYPNPQWGYGIIDLYKIFKSIGNI